MNDEKMYCCYDEFSDKSMGLGGTLDERLNEKLEELVITHKQRQYNILNKRYKEFLPVLLSYNYPNDDTHKKLSINFMKMEVALRCGEIPVIGEKENGSIAMLGLCRNYKSYTDPQQLYSYDRMSFNNIDFRIPEKFIKKDKKYDEIWDLDDYSTGNFTVCKNKIVELQSDYKIINQYCHELAEISGTRYSLIIQAKVHTIIKAKRNSEDGNRLISKLYNGAPYFEMTNAEELEDIIFRIENPYISQNLISAKNEYQNKISELNNILGINSLAVDKESGVSDIEAKSNSAYTTSNANLYLKSRQHFLNNLNKRYGFKIIVEYDDHAISELTEFANNSLEGGGVQ